MQRYLFPAGLLILAAALQGNLPWWLEFKGARPDLVLVVIISASLTLDPLDGALIGFVGGLLHGSIVGYSLGSFIVSRTIAGAAAGSVTIRFFSDNPVVPVLAAGGITFGGEMLFLLANPVSNVAGALNILLVKSLFNSMLTFFAFWILRWIDVRKKIKMASARL